MSTEMISPDVVAREADVAKQHAVAFVEQNKIAVTDRASYERAAQIRTAIGEKLKGIEAQLEKPKSWAHGLHKWFCTLESAAKAPYLQLDAYEREELRVYKAEQDRLREVRERELAEQQRRQDESRAAAEAAAHERAGDHAMAEAVMAEAIAAPAPVVSLPDTTKGVAGLSFTRRYLWKYFNGPATVKDTPPAVITRALSLVPREFLMLDERKVSAYAKAMKGGAKVPGLEFYYVDDPTR
jgi:hypothetical protein